MKFKDARIAKLLEALKRRFPGTTAITWPVPDAGVFDECWIKLLNAPTDPPTLVDEFANPLIDELWGDEPVPVLVSAVSRENTAKYYAKYLPKVQPARVPRKRGAPVAAARSTKAPARRRRPSAV